MSDPKAWARKLVAEYESGDGKRPGNVYRVAFEALRLTFPEGEPPKNAGKSPKNVQECSGAQRNSRPVAAPRTALVDEPWWDCEPGVA